MKTVWYYWMHWRATFWDDMTAEEVDVLGPHADYVERLHDENRVVVAGGIMEPAGGIVCFFATDRDDATSVMEADPLYAANIVDITLHELHAGFIGGTRYSLANEPAAESVS
ncbi:MAG: YciI family protein [Chloroflexi bacterium]|nr:YciI family protein [Chloroflexota bacterium]